MKILIVEDEPKARNGLAMLVKKFEPSASVQTAENGLDALGICEKNMFDIIFTDIKIPGMNGLEMLDKMELYCRQIIIVSEYADFSYAQTAIQHGVTDYLLKPVSPSKIRTILQQAEKKIHSIKQSCLAKYLQEYIFWDEAHNRYLESKLDLSNPILVIQSQMAVASSNVHKIQEDLENIGNISGCKTYHVIQGSKVFWIVSGKQLENIQKTASERKCSVQVINPQKLPEFYQKLMQGEPILTENHSRGGRTVRLVTKFIREHYASDISLKTLSEITYLHPNYLSKIFKRETGENISDYLLHYRIEQAKQLLGDPSLKIYEVAEKSGFHTSKYFAAVFKNVVSMTPSEYQDSL